MHLYEPMKPQLPPLKGRKKWNIRLHQYRTLAQQELKARLNLTHGDALGLELQFYNISHVFFVLSMVDGPLDGFHVFDIVNRARRKNNHFPSLTPGS